MRKLPNKIRVRVTGLALLALSLLLANCRSTPAAVAPAPAAPVTSTSAPFHTPIPLPLHTLTPPHPTPPKPHHNHTTTQPHNDTPCGLLLPLQPASAGPAVTRLEAEIPDDLVPPTARPALQRLLSAPEAVGLAAYVVGREAEGVYLNADTPMPLASVTKIITLVAYAEAANAGRLDPAAWIPLDDLEQYYLPGSDLGAHNRAVQELRERDLVAFNPPATPLEEIPWMMIRHSSNAASDYLHLTLGQETIETTVLNLGLASHTAPCPFVGQFLAMGNHTLAGNYSATLESYLTDPAAYGREVMYLAALYTGDESFHRAEVAGRWNGPPPETQALFSENLNAQASALDYAHLMARIVQNQLSVPYVNILVRRALEWPMAFPDNQALFTTIGYKNGSLPGILTTVYYAQRLEDGAVVVVALFYRHLPLATYRYWRNALPHDELARWLLADPTAIPALRELLSTPSLNSTMGVGSSKRQHSLIGD